MTKHHNKDTNAIEKKKVKQNKNNVFQYNNEIF